MYEDVIQILTVLGALGGAAGTVYSSWRWCVKPIAKFFKNISRACEALPSIEAELKEIQEELKPNSGCSLRDAINRIERNSLIEKHARRAMSMAMDVAMFEADSSGKCVWINQMYSSLSGLSISESRGYGWVNGVDENDRDRVVDEWDESVEQSRSFHMSYKMRNINTNKVTNVKCDSFPICNDKGEVVGHVGIIAVLPND